MQLDKAILPMKGQVNSLDLGASFIAMIMLCCLTTAHTHNIVQSSLEKQEEVSLKKRLYEATESLVTTPGKPLNWHSPGSELERIGLAKTEVNEVLNHDLDPDKIKTIKRIDLSELKKGLGLRDEEISLSLSNLNGEEVLDIGDSSDIELVRIVLLEGDIHILKLGARD